jgi:hypothetical protein
MNMGWLGFLAFTFRKIVDIGQYDRYPLITASVETTSCTIIITNKPYSSAAFSLVCLSVYLSLCFFIVFAYGGLNLFFQVLCSMYHRLDLLTSTVNIDFNVIFIKS